MLRRKRTAHIGYTIYGIGGALILCFAEGPFAAARDCDGYIVTDSAIVDSALAAQLANANDTAFLNFGIGLRWAGYTPAPDSCSHINVECPEQPKDTISAKYWEKWSQDLFGNHEIFLKEFPQHRVTAGVEFGITDSYTPLRAKKSTILAIEQECYVWELVAFKPGIPTGISSPLSNSTRKDPVSNFNVKGQKLDAHVKLPFNGGPSQIMHR